MSVSSTASLSFPSLGTSSASSLSSTSSTSVPASTPEDADPTITVFHGQPPTSESVAHRLLRNTSPQPPQKSPDLTPDDFETKRPILQPEASTVSLQSPSEPPSDTSNDSTRTLTGMPSSWSSGLGSLTQLQTPGTSTGQGSFTVAESSQPLIERTPVPRDSKVPVYDRHALADFCYLAQDQSDGFIRPDAPPPFKRASACERITNSVLHAFRSAFSVMTSRTIGETTMRSARYLVNHIITTPGVIHSAGPRTILGYAMSTVYAGTVAVGAYRATQPYAQAVLTYQDDKGEVRHHGGKHNKALEFALANVPCMFMTASIIMGGWGMPMGPAHAMLAYAMIDDTTKTLLIAAVRDRVNTGLKYLFPQALGGRDIVTPEGKALSPELQKKATNVRALVIGGTYTAASMLVLLNLFKDPVGSEDLDGISRELLAPVNLALLLAGFEFIDEFGWALADEAGAWAVGGVVTVSPTRGAPGEQLPAIDDGWQEAPPSDMPPDTEITIPSDTGGGLPESKAPVGSSEKMQAFRKDWSAFKQYWKEQGPIIDAVDGVRLLLSSPLSVTLQGRSLTGMAGKGSFVLPLSHAVLLGLSEASIVPLINGLGASAAEKAAHAQDNMFAKLHYLFKLTSRGDMSADWHKPVLQRKSTPAVRALIATDPAYYADVEKHFLRAAKATREDGPYQAPSYPPQRMQDKFGHVRTSDEFTAPLLPAR